MAGAGRPVPDHRLWAARRRAYRRPPDAGLAVRFFIPARRWPRPLRVRWSPPEDALPAGSPAPFSASQPKGHFISRLTRFRSHLLTALHEVFVDDVEIYRKPRSTEILADCHHSKAEQILQNFGFEPPQGRRHQHRLPENLSWAEKKARATQAVVHLTAAGLVTNFDFALICPDARAAALDEIYGSRPQQLAPAV